MHGGGATSRYMLYERWAFNKCGSAHKKREGVYGRRGAGAAFIGRWALMGVQWESFEWDQWVKLLMNLLGQMKLQVVPSPSLWSGKREIPCFWRIERNAEKLYSLKGQP